MPAYLWLRDTTFYFHPLFFFYFWHITCKQWTGNFPCPLYPIWQSLPWKWRSTLYIFSIISTTFGLELSGPLSDWVLIISISVWIACYLHLPSLFTWLPQRVLDTAPRTHEVQYPFVLIPHLPKSQEMQSISNSILLFITYVPSLLCFLNLYMRSPKLLLFLCFILLLLLFYF